jgi:ubiquinone/menaquinone biosynthesis C-methylase UbiE
MASREAPGAPKFDGKIPEFYDSGHGTHVMEPFAEKFIEQIREILPPSLFMEQLKILELACGTGRLTKKIVSAFPNASIIATDISPDMIEMGKTLVTNRGSDQQQLEWGIADIQALPFENDSFDLVFCQYGYMFCPDKVKAFEESNRVLKSNAGRLLALVWDKIELHPLLFPLYQHLTTNYPTVSTGFLQTACNMFDRDATTSLLEQCKFRDVLVQSVAIHTGYPSKANALKSMISGTPLSNCLVQDGVDLNAFEEGAKTIYDQYQQPDGSDLELAFDMHAILVHGAK